MNMNKNEYQRNHTKYSMPIHRIQPNHRLMQKGTRSCKTEPLFPRFGKFEGGNSNFVARKAPVRFGKTQQVVKQELANHNIGPLALF